MKQMNEAMIQAYVELKKKKDNSSAHYDACEHVWRNLSYKEQDKALAILGWWKE